ncbi:ankyrin domain protein [Aulographum hederae CBS 113979]|uniref:Ankyrin domain protein n=1 Tax=Aulographum hederae CBS 113979 TaxID=1176131 RepID=A0A6G1GX48_9PEZI|nr:ankyrin domain protein [Aulographum hederae CBS 113979]
MSGNDQSAASGTVEASPPKSVSELPPAAIELATTLFNHARHNNSESLATLSQYLQAGIPPNLTNGSGDTLLMLASYHGHIDIVRMLLEQGADPNVLNDRGQSPIAGAVFKGYDEVVMALWKGGADEKIGQPCAKDAAVMFKKENYLAMFERERNG